jgi:hypothetical protein
VQIRLDVNNLVAVFAIERHLAHVGLACVLIEAVALGVSWNVDVEGDGWLSVRRVFHAMQANRIYVQTEMKLKLINCQQNYAELNRIQAGTFSILRIINASLSS